MAKKKKINKWDPEFDPKHVCHECGIKYGKDTGIICNIAMCFSCEICEDSNITMPGHKYGPYTIPKDFKEKE